jgi:hypothetical protein
MAHPEASAWMAAAVVVEVVAAAAITALTLMAVVVAAAVPAAAGRHPPVVGGKGAAARLACTWFPAAWSFATPLFSEAREESVATAVWAGSGNLVGWAELEGLDPIRATAVSVAKVEMAVTAVAVAAAREVRLAALY